MNKLDTNDIEIQKAWQKLAAEKFSNNIFKKQEIMDAIKLESNSTIAYLSKGLKHKIRFALGFAILFIVSVFIFKDDFVMQMFLGALAIAYLLGAFLMNRQYTKVSSETNNGQNVLENLKIDLNHIKSTLKIETVWGILVFLSMASFYIVKITLSSEMEPIKIAITIIAIILICVLAHYGAAKMNDMRFGKDIKKLEANIIRLETLS